MADRKMVDPDSVERDGSKVGITIMNVKGDPDGYNIAQMVECDPPIEEGEAIDDLDPLRQLAVQMEVLGEHDPLWFAKAVKFYWELMRCEARLPDAPEELYHVAHALGHSMKALDEVDPADVPPMFKKPRLLGEDEGNGGER